MASEEDVVVQDLFCQWKSPYVVLDAADSTDLEEAEFDTGLALFADYAWALHGVEFWPSSGLMKMASTLAADAYNTLKMCIGRSGLSSIVPNAPGVMALKEIYFGESYLTSGIAVHTHEAPIEWRPPTPVPIAASKLSLYAQSEVDHADLRSSVVRARLYFTLIPTTPQLWKELAERWALD